MLRRFRAREVALQLLFQQDQNKTPMPRKALVKFVKDRTRKDADAVVFALALYDGAVAHRESIDALITATSQNWRLTRMLPADRSILRLGTFELLHAAKFEPVAVVLNESIELAKLYGSKDSPSFVNGLLDKIAQGRPAAEPAKADA